MTLQEMFRGRLSPVPQAPGRLIPPQPAQVLDPYGAELEPELPISPRGGLVAAVPTLSEFVSRNASPQASGSKPLGSLDKETTLPRRSVQAVVAPTMPTLATMASRDFGRENRNAGDAALMAGLFGLGLGSRGGVAAGPTLAAAAAKGSRDGADERFKAAVDVLQDQNKAVVDQYGLAQDKFRMDELDANRAGDELFRSDQLSQKRAVDRANYFAGLDGLDEPSLQAKLERDFRGGVLDGLGIDGIRREDGTFDVVAVTTAKQKAAADMEASRLADDEKSVLDVIRRTAPGGRQGVLNALAPGLVARGGRFVQDATTGNWSMPGVDLASLDAAATGANSPEALAAKETKAQADAGRRGALELLDTWGQLIAGDRLKPEARTELWKRSGIVRDALAKGEPIPSWVWEMSPDAVAAMSPAQRERLDNDKVRLGLAKSAQEETRRHNYASEARLLAESKKRTEKAGAAPSARFEAASSEYAQLRDYYTRLMNNDLSVPAVDRQAHTQQRNNVLRRLGEIESKYPALGKGWSAGDSPTKTTPSRTITGPGGKTYNVKKVK